MATRKINYGTNGNNSIEKTAKGGDKINTQNYNDRISTELWMEHLANALLKENAIDERTHRKLMVKITQEVNRRFSQK